MAKTLNLNSIYARQAQIAAAKGTEDEYHSQTEVAEEVLQCRTATRKGFRAFYEYVCQLEPAEHMDIWIEELITEEDSACLKGVGGYNTNILAPRGSAKSTVLTFFVAWVIGIHYAPDVQIPIQIMYLSYSQETAIPKSDEIRMIIDSDRYREVFPWVRPSKSIWASKKWMIDKVHAGINPIGSAAYTLVTSGITGSVVSKRCHLIVIDDIIKSALAIENPAIREKMETNWDSAARPTMLDGGRAVCLGTRFRADDIHCTKFNAKGGWILLEQSAIIEEQNEQGDITRYSYWPQMYSLEYLEKYEHDSPLHFAFQYQNTLEHAKTSGIHPDWIHKSMMPTYFDVLAVGGDLATGKTAKNDYTVFTLGGRRDNRYFILDMVRGRWTGNIEKLDALLNMLSLWGVVDVEENDDGTYQYIPTSDPCYLFIESNAYQASLKGDFESYVMQEHGITNLIYKKKNSTGDKRSRFDGITGIFGAHQVWFNQYADFNEMYREITNVGATAHDDCCDSLEKLLSGLRSRKKLQAI